MKWLLCELLFSCGLGFEAMPLDELTYRTVLYDYYQEQYDDALVRTLVAEAQNRTGEDSDRFTLARGSFAFKDGMYGYARETFDSVDADELSREERIRLAFHLARVHHQRQDWPALERELGVFSNLEANLEEPLTHPEVAFMKVDLALAKGDTAAALSALGTLPENDPYRAYALYNLGVLYREQNRPEQAKQIFETLSELDATSDDSFDLIQRAKLALAYMMREDGVAGNAQTVIESLPGEGRYRDVALATYGNLAMQSDDAELAARIWLTLQQDQSWTASAAAARLGLPMSLESIAEPQVVLNYYQQAERGFEARLVALDGLVQQSGQPGWVRQLAEAFARGHEDDAVMLELLEGWEQDIGHREWVEWLAGEDANRLLTQWRQLDDMKSYLSELPRTLESFSEVAQEQRRRAARSREMLRDEGLMDRRQTTATTIENLSARLARLDQVEPYRNEPRDPQWYAALADGEELELLQKLWRQQKTIARGFEGEARTRWLARVQRLLGVVYFKLESEFAARHWALTRRLHDLQAVLEDVDERIARVASAEAHFTAGAGASFEGYARRAEQIIARVDLALSNRETALASILRGRFHQERQRVEQYLFVTRVAIAQATDRLAVATVQEGDS